MDEIHPTTSITQEPFWKRGGLARLSLIALILSILSTIYTLISNKANLTTVVYPLVTDFFGIGTFLCSASCIVIPIMFAAVSYFVFENWKNPKDHPQRYHSEMLVVVFAMIFCGISLCVAVSDLGETLMHRDSTELSGSIYNLTLHNTYDDLGYGNYILYKCAGSGIVCSMVHKTEWGTGSIYDQKAKLIVDDRANTLSIVIDGETIYTYTPE